MKTSAEITKSIKQLKKEYQEAAKAEFLEGTTELFAANPRLKSFGWRQYTPHFNDGDECTFSARIDDPDINGFSEWGDKEEGDGENLRELSQETVWDGGKSNPNPNIDKGAVKTVKAVEKFLKGFEEDYFKEAFGDHQQVKVTAKGVETEDYDHD